MLSFNVINQNIFQRNRTDLNRYHFPSFEYRHLEKKTKLYNIAYNQRSFGENVSISVVIFNHALDIAAVCTAAFAGSVVTNFETRHLTNGLFNDLLENCYIEVCILQG